MEAIIGNVFLQMPENGDVVAQLTEEDIKIFKAIDMHYVALSHNPTVYTKEETIRITQDRQEWWQRIAEQYGYPYAWPVRLDIVTGQIYIDK